MAPEIFKRLASEVGSHGAYLRVSGGGEPMLHPQAVEFLEFAKRADMVGHLGRPRVLFIDDNLTQLDLHALVLRDVFHVMTASRAEIGRVVAKQERPDAVVADVLLPDGDGLELCNGLFLDPSTASAAIIVLTGDDAAFARARSDTSASRTAVTMTVIVPALFWDTVIAEWCSCVYLANGIDFDKSGQV